MKFLFFLLLIPFIIGQATAQQQLVDADIFSDRVEVTIPEGTAIQGCETTNGCYLPYEAKVNVGGEVIWTNDDMAFHTVTSGSPAEGPNDVFDSGMFKVDEQFSQKFEKSGTFDYFCTLHPWMEGKVIVKEDAKDTSENVDGGCLIATAAYGSELSQQVQNLRELRDNKLLQTESGKSFMKGFNEFYYSFSPHIADYQRENHVFREAVKIAITPMVSSLSILNYVSMESEYEVIGYGISLIALNIGMYVGIPIAFVAVGLRRKL